MWQFANCQQRYATLDIGAQLAGRRIARRPHVLLQLSREHVHITPVSGLLLLHRVVLAVLGAAHLGRLLVVAVHEQLQLLAGVVVSDLLVEMRTNGGTKLAVGLGLRLATQGPPSRLLTRFLKLDQDGVDSHSLFVVQPDTYGWRLLGSQVRVVTARLE